MLKYSLFSHSSISLDNQLKNIFINQCYTPLINPTFALTHLADLLSIKCSDPETQQLTELLKQQVKEIDLVVKRFLLFIDEPPQWEQYIKSSPNRVIHEVLQVLIRYLPLPNQICSDFDSRLESPFPIPVYLLETLSFHLLSNSLERLNINLQFNREFQPFIYVSTQLFQDKWILIIEDNSQSDDLHLLKCGFESSVLAGVGNEFPTIERFLVKVGGKLNCLASPEKNQFILSFPLAGAERSEVF